MLISSRFRIATLALAAGAVPLILALSLHGQSSPYPPYPAATGGAQQAARDLDAIMQPRFQDDRAGVFGTGRLVPTVRGHIAVNYFQPVTPLEKQLWAQVTGSHPPFWVGFLHCAHVPGKFVDAPTFVKAPPTTITSPLRFTPGLAKPYISDLIDQSVALEPDWWKDSKRRAQIQAQSEARQALFQQAATDALPELRLGQGQEKVTENWLVVMRPVRASKDSCLTCHVGAKRGDTLGVMVYAVSNTVNKN